MKKINPALLVIIILTTVYLPIFAQNNNHSEKGIRFVHSSWDEILNESKKLGKPIFLDAYASWCGPCKWMSREIFTNDTVGNFYNEHFINAKIDMEKGEGITLAQKYGVNAYPTLLYIDPSGEVLHRTCGSVPADEFIQNGKDALNPERQLKAVIDKYNSGSYDADFVYSYLTILDNACMDFQQDLNKYLKKVDHASLTQRSNWQILSRFLKNSENESFKYLVANKNTFSNLYSKDSVEQVIGNIYKNALIGYIKKKDMAGYNTLKTRIRKEAGADADKILLSGDMVLFKKNKDWDHYASAAEQLISEYEKDDFMLMNEAAWTIYENSEDKQLLLKAEKWAKKGVELNDSYALNDTYAAVLYKLGKKEQARKAAEHAIEIGKKEGADTKETEELLAKIASR